MCDYQALKAPVRFIISLICSLVFIQHPCSSKRVTSAFQERLHEWVPSGGTQDVRQRGLPGSLQRALWKRRDLIVGSSELLCLGGGRCFGKATWCLVSAHPWFCIFHMCDACPFPTPTPRSDGPEFPGHSLIGSLLQKLGLGGFRGEHIFSGAVAVRRYTNVKIFCGAPGHPCMS